MLCQFLSSSTTLSSHMVFTVFWVPLELNCLSDSLPTKILLLLLLKLNIASSVKIIHSKWLKNCNENLRLSVENGGLSLAARLYRANLHRIPHAMRAVTLAPLESFILYVSPQQSENNWYLTAVEWTIFTRLLAVLGVSGWSCHYHCRYIN